MMNRCCMLTQILLGMIGLLLLTTACGGTPTPQVTLTIGSKEFTEQLILGEMYILLLEDAGFNIERRFSLGGSPAL